MTEKNILAYKLFLSLNISDLNLFFMWKLQYPPPLWKKSPPLSQQPPSKSWGPFKPPTPFWKFGWRLNPPSSRKDGGCTLYMYMLYIYYIYHIYIIYIYILYLYIIYIYYMYIYIKCIHSICITYIYIYIYIVYIIYIYSETRLRTCPKFSHITFFMGSEVNRGQWEDRE